ncbi:hypothetical protein, partial [Saccharopolyspora shandongensis]|uniref:hypothetical protein n=1 Tax=Saccharopolyspora shandongensis TaxID=418495 RepID=UPI001C4335EF
MTLLLMGDLGELLDQSRGVADVTEADLVAALGLGNNEPGTLETALDHDGGAPHAKRARWESGASGAVNAPSEGALLAAQRTFSVLKAEVRSLPDVSHSDVALNSVAAYENFRNSYARALDAGDRAMQEALEAQLRIDLAVKRNSGLPGGSRSAGQSADVLSSQPGPSTSNPTATREKAPLPISDVDPGPGIWGAPEIREQVGQHLGVEPEVLEFLHPDLVEAGSPEEMAGGLKELLGDYGLLPADLEVFHGQIDRLGRADLEGFRDYLNRHRLTVEAARAGSRTRDLTASLRQWRFPNYQQLANVHRPNRRNLAGLFRSWRLGVEPGAFGSRDLAWMAQQATSRKLTREQAADLAKQVKTLMHNGPLHPRLREAAIEWGVSPQTVNELGKRFKIQPHKLRLSWLGDVPVDQQRRIAIVAVRNWLDMADLAADRLRFFFDMPRLGAGELASFRAYLDGADGRTDEFGRVPLKVVREWWQNLTKVSAESATQRVLREKFPDLAAKSWFDPEHDPARLQDLADHRLDAEQLGRLATALGRVPDELPLVAQKQNVDVHTLLWAAAELGVEPLPLAKNLAETLNAATREFDATGTRPSDVLRGIAEAEGLTSQAAWAQRVPRQMPPPMEADGEGVVKFPPPLYSEASSPSYQEPTGAPPQYEAQEGERSASEGLDAEASRRIAKG